MKNLFTLTIVMLLASLLMAQNQPKTVAVLETKTDPNVSDFQRNMIRGSIESAIANSKGYEGFNRSAFDDIMKEQNFQRSGAVDENQIKELGKMAGVQYILVTEASSENGRLYVSAKLLDVETGKYVKANDKLCEANIDAIRAGCVELAEYLFDVTLSYHNSSTPPKLDYSNQIKSNKIGDLIVFPDGTQGVCFYIENGRGLAVSLTEAELKWDASRKCEDVLSLDNTDENNHPFIYGQGKSNTQAIIQQLGTTAEAANWCSRIGEGWYMPSAGELYYLMTVSKKGTTLYNKLNLRGIVLNGWYWACTEHNGKEAINISDGGTVFTENKNAAKVRVRAVRTFEVDE